MFKVGDKVIVCIAWKEVVQGANYYNTDWNKFINGCVGVVTGDEQLRSIYSNQYESETATVDTIGYLVMLDNDRIEAVINGCHLRPFNDDANPNERCTWSNSVWIPKGVKV